MAKRRRRRKHTEALKSTQKPNMMTKVSAAHGATAKSKGQEERKNPMTFADAAEKVLRGHGSKMKNSRLTKEAIKLGYLITSSSRPETSMYVALRSDNRSRERRGIRPRFVFESGGMVGLSEWSTGDEYDRLIESAGKTREKAAKNLIDRLIENNSGSDFEEFIGGLLVKMGYENVEVIGGNDDQGVDITCEETRGIVTRKIAIQCKCKNKRKRIGPKDVSTLRDNLSTQQADTGIIITTARLNEDAIKKAAEPGKERILFIEGTQLADLCIQHLQGIRKQTIDVYDLDREAYPYLASDEDRKSREKHTANRAAKKNVAKKKKKIVKKTRAKKKRKS